MGEKNFGEVKTKKNLFPSEAQKIVDKGTVGIIISQCKVSNKTKSVLDNAGIVIYEGVEAEKVEELLEQLEMENIEKEGEVEK